MSYQPFRVDYYGNALVKNNDPLTAFGDQRVAMLSPIINETFAFNINSNKFNTTTTGSGVTADVNDFMARVQTSATINSSSVMETKKHMRYLAGIGIMTRFTGKFTTGVAGSQQILGLGHDTDGVFFGYNGTDFGILRRSSASGSLVDTWVTQSSWSEDKCDGTQNLPNMIWTNINVFQIQIQWLGAGELRFEVEDPQTGQFETVHKIKYANANTVPSMAIPSLPYYMFVENTSNNTNIVLHSASVGVFEEGIKPSPSLYYSIDNTKASITTQTNVLTIKNRDTFHSQVNNIPIIPKLISVACVGNKSVTIKIIIDTTLGGIPSYSDIDTNNSTVEYDTAGTTVSGGRTLATYLLAKEDSINLDVSNLAIQLTNQTLTISAESANATEVTCSVTWGEFL